VQSASAKCKVQSLPRVFPVSGRASQEGSRLMVGSLHSPMGVFSSVISTLQFAWEEFYFMPHLLCNSQY